MTNKYYPTQLTTEEVQERVVQEYQIAMAHFPGAALIPGKVEIWQSWKLGAHLVQMFQANGQKYVVYCAEDGIRIDDHTLSIVRVKVSPVIKSTFFGEISPGNYDGCDWRVEIKGEVYVSSEWYKCESPVSIRKRAYRASQPVWWYFTDFETPQAMLEKIAQRKRKTEEPIMVIKLRRTPYKGYKKNAIYKRFERGYWVLVNQNGRESRYYDLTK